MTHHFSPLRRKMLAASLLVPGAALIVTAKAAPDPHTALLRLEQQYGGRIGLGLYDVQGKPLLQYRATERFAMCSTFKLMLVACILKHSETDPTLLSRHIDYDKQALVSYSPETEKNLGHGMSVQELCAATMTLSDNTAANLLLDQVGGPKGLTDFARGIGDNDFSSDRRETDLGTAIPGDKRDTTTPQAMAQSLRRLTFGELLATPQRDQLMLWLRNNKTGPKRIPAGVPAGWTVGHKTGSGEYGTTNDVAVLQQPGQPPLFLAIYFTQHRKSAPLRDDVLASATRLALASIQNLS